MRHPILSLRRRLSWAMALSALIHLGVLALLAAAYRPAPPTPPPAPPLLVRLEPDPRHNLVDAPNPANTPPERTPNIAETDTRAADLVDNASDTPAPHVEEIAPQDAPAAAPAPAPPAETASSPPPPTEPAQAPARPRPPRAPAPAAPLHIAAAPPAALENAQRAEAPEATAAPAPSAPPALPVPEADPASGPPSHARGRLSGQVDRRGFAGFDALQDELAPYLRHVRERVEREWHALLLTRYMGARPVQAVIECAIDPGGALVLNALLDPGPDPLYAALCREALQRAAPFNPFPFDVPDLYRSKNLQITWSFNFL